MPLVRIDVQTGRTPAELRCIADVVQDVMLDVFAAPPRDRYQIITEHPVGQIIAEDTGLGFERTDGVTVIQIFQQGRSVEPSQRLGGTRLIGHRDPRRASRDDERPVLLAHLPFRDGLEPPHRSEPLQRRLRQHLHLHR